MHPSTAVNRVTLGKDQIFIEQILGAKIGAPATLLKSWNSTRQSCRVCVSEIIKWGGQKVKKNPRDGQLESLIEEILALIEKLPSL